MRINESPALNQDPETRLKKILEAIKKRKFLRTDHRARETNIIAFLERILAGSKGIARSDVKNPRDAIKKHLVAEGVLDDDAEWFASMPQDTPKRMLRERKYELEHDLTSEKFSLPKNIELRMVLETQLPNALRWFAETDKYRAGVPFSLMVAFVKGLSRNIPVNTMRDEVKIFLSSLVKAGTVTMIDQHNGEQLYLPVKKD